MGLIMGTLPGDDGRERVGEEAVVFVSNDGSAVLTTVCVTESREPSTLPGKLIRVSNGSERGGRTCSICVADRTAMPPK